MQEYIKDYFSSRHRSMYGKIPCEVCRALKNFKAKTTVRSAADIHHIRPSFRGKRKHNNDGSDLISVCREHHEWIHSNNNSDTREWLLSIVGVVLQKVNNRTNVCYKPIAPLKIKPLL